MSYVALIVLMSCQADEPGTTPPAQQNLIFLQNDQCRIAFDAANGALRGIANLLVNDECLKEAAPEGMPFRVYMDFTKAYELGDSPAAIARTVLQPSTCRLARVQPEDKALMLEYEGRGLAMRLHVTLEERTGVSEWTLRIANIGAEPQQILPCFPRFNGVRLGPDASRDLATVMNQGGTIAPAWKHHGGVVGNAFQMSMQWHAIWDPETRSALALIIMDPDAKAKQLVLERPDISLLHFPPLTLAPGDAIDLPAVKLLVYEGDWRPAARAYRAWYDKSFTHAKPPAWFDDMAAWDGRHFKKAGPGITADYGGQFVLDSFRDLPRAVLRAPIDHIEYAFYSRGSMLYGKHTDGDNVIREDLGGPEAMRDGIASLHRLGLHTTLYIEGYIVSNESELAKSGKAEQWSVMHKDGSITGGYTKQGFLHMCPGCVAWQDHLASTAARLLRETGADGVRLDSLGFYFLPCYNPAHEHATPFGYNEWMKQLLAKVREAALAVNPDALLTTEAPVDWFGQWFHGALTQVYPRDLPPMRLAVAPYRPITYAPGGPVWGSIAGLAGGRTCWEADLGDLEGNWICARFPVHKTLIAGDVPDEDPHASDPGIVARMFQGDGHWAIVAARPACQDANEWPAATGLSPERKDYALTAHGLPETPLKAALCDIETLTWKPLEIEHNGDTVRMQLGANWALIVLTPADGPDVITVGPPPTTAPGERVVLKLATVPGVPREGQPLPVSVGAPGLTVGPPTAAVPGDAVVEVPPDALPGFYAITISGQHLLGAKRFLRVK